MFGLCFFFFRKSLVSKLTARPWQASCCAAKTPCCCPGSEEQQEEPPDSTAGCMPSSLGEGQELRARWFGGGRLGLSLEVSRSLLQTSLCIMEGNWCSSQTRRGHAEHLTWQEVPVHGQCISLQFYLLCSPHIFGGRKVVAEITEEKSHALPVRSLHVLFQRAVGDGWRTPEVLLDPGDWWPTRGLLSRVSLAWFPSSWQAARPAVHLITCLFL